MKKSRTMKRLNVLRAAAVVTALAMAGCGYGCAWHTFVRWWEPVVWAAVLGAAVCRLLYRPAAALMRVKRRIAVISAAWIWGACVIYGSMLGANYCFADRSTARHEEAVITGKYSEERTRYRRVGRGRSVPDGTYKVYYVSVRFSNGAERDLPVSAGRYTKARKGQSEHFIVEKGLLGFPVFKSGRTDKVSDKE